MTATEAHPLFRAHPPTGAVRAGGVEQPVPYCVYDGHGTLIVGTADLAAVSLAFAGQDVHPVQTASGRGLLGLFVCRFDRASHGPHLELHLTALASEVPDERLRDVPEAFLAGLGPGSGRGALSLHLWNDVASVVAYNCDYLGLGARLATGTVMTSGDRLRFAFEADGAPLASGDLRLTRRPGLREAAALLRLMGPRAFIGAARAQTAEAAVINRKCDVLPRNARAHTLTAPDRVGIARIDPASDKLTLTGSELAAYGFQPLCAQHLSPFRFVYLAPDAG